MLADRLALDSGRHPVSAPAFVTMRYELFVGLRYLRARRSERFISLLTLISILGRHDRRGHPQSW